MDNNQAVKNLNDLNLLFETLGFDDKTKKDHLSRIMTIVFSSASDKIDKTIMSDEKVEFTEMKSFEDFYNYYERFVDRDTINKILEEETSNAFHGYFSAISDKLPK
jgi:hypothetical protein